MAASAGLPCVLALVLSLAVSQRWVGLPLGTFLAVVWMVACGFPRLLPVEAVVVLGQWALWTELAAVLAPAEPDGAPPELTESVFGGMVGGAAGGMGLQLLAGVPGAMLGLAFLGAWMGGWARGFGLDAPLRITLGLPREGDRSATVGTVFILAMVAGLVARG